MNMTQSIPNPFGINVFGSALLRVAPDIAFLKFTVSRLEQQPGDAFRHAREAARAVRTYLAEVGVGDVQSSRITLTQSFRYVGGEQRFLGYAATVAFHVLLRDLDRMEDVLTGVIGAGANEIDAVEFQTSRLKEIRAQARRRAVAAAREKAALYCEAADVTLGPVMHIEDINPEQLRGREGHTVQATQADDAEAPRAVAPGSIAVGAAVMVAFELAQ